MKQPIRDHDGHMLTRELYVVTLNLFARSTEDERDHGPLRADLIAHVDALREQLAERDARIQKLESHKVVVDSLMNEGSQKIDELRQQLAEVTKECRKVGYETVKELADSFCDLANERTHLRDQLATARQDVWGKAARKFDETFFATDHRLDHTRDYRVDEFYTWLSEHAKAEGTR